MKRISLLLLLFISLIFSCKEESKVDPKSTLKDMLSFSFKQSANASLAMDVEAMLVGKAVGINLPPLSKTAALKATFTISPLSHVSVNGVSQESGVTANDFTKPVTYRVTAEDGSTADYTVTATVAKSGDKTMTTFAFLKADNPDLPADLVATLSGTQFSATLPVGIKSTALKASFAVSPMATITVKGIKQESGTTANDFTSPLVYKVTAEDGSSIDYTVSVNTTKASDKELISFSFLKANNSSLSQDVPVAISSTKGYYLITLPQGANIKALKPTFIISGNAAITVSNASQISGETANDFSGIVTYRVAAQDGSTKDFLIEGSVQVELLTIENAVNAFMSKYEIPGMSVAITKDERLVYAKGYGLANKEKGEPVTNNSIFRIASVSKSITAITLLTLVESGKVSLEQKVFGAGGVLGTTYGKQPYSPQLLQITVRHVLSHTAGGDAWNHVWNYPTRIDPFYQPEWIGYTQAQVISAVLDTRPVTETPGTRMVYSNVGMNIAGRIIEKVTGVNYEKYVQDNILAPIGITSASMHIGGSTLAERAPNEVVYYNPYSGYDQPYDFPVPRLDAHGGWTTTAVNLARLLSFADGMTAKKDIITASTWKDMITPSAVSVPAGGYAGYGLGWFASVNGAYWHEGGMAGTSSYWMKIGTYTFAILVNTRSTAALADGAIDKLCYQMTADLTLTGYLKGDQFDVFYK